LNIIPATPAPEFKGIEKWNDKLNHSIKEYKGKVVLLDFWTYTCIFCLRTIPTIEELTEKYSHLGFEVISIHSAEYDFAKEEDNILRALKTYDLDKFLTGFDTSNKTWEIYGNSYWPKHVLIDKEGFVRYEHPGYGAPNEFDEALKDLFDIPKQSSQSDTINPHENSSTMETKVEGESVLNSGPESSTFEQNRISKQYGMHFPGMAPEICVGYSRMRRFGNNQKVKMDEFNVFNDLPPVMDNVVYLKGKWIWEREGVGVTLDHKDKTPAIVFKYNSASNVNIIAGSTDGKPTIAEILLDGKHLQDEQLGYDSKKDGDVSFVNVTWPHIMNIVKTLKPSSHKLEIIPKSDNFYFYTFVFG
jgi:thiol-disulfide isomerase/thioredoxin